MMAYNFDKDTCDLCGITKEKAKEIPVLTGIDHPKYKYSTSFYYSFTGEVLCAQCHRGKEIGQVIDKIGNKSGDE